jgi:hypothetical protein
MGHLRTSRIAIALIAIFCSSAISLRAQVLKGTILGTITDSSQAVIAGAQVAVTETNTNVSRNVTTNSSGFYGVPNLDPGTYRVEVQHPGFRRMVRAGIDLVANSTARVDLELSPGAVSEVLEVTEARPLLQTDRADVGGTINRTQLQTMPMGFNRNYQSLIALLPGVGRTFRPHSEFYNSQDSLGSRVNGFGRHMNNFQLEGVDNNFDNGALTGIILPAEAIGSVDISTSNYDPEFGNAGGAVTTVTMASGTNQYHGNVFAYHYNKSLRANQPFATTKPPMVYNQFGGVIAGPIIRDKWFFFGDYQGSRDHFGGSNLAVIPTMEYRSGDLSASPTTIYDPATGNADGTGRQPFANKQIPTARLSPIVQKILAVLPPPTSPGLGTNFQKNTTRIKNLNSFDTKVDYVLGSNDRFAVRYNYQQAFVIDPVPGLYGIYGGPHNNGFNGTGPARVQSSGVSYSHIFSPTLMTELRLGFVRSYNRVDALDFGLKTAESFGIPGVNRDLWSSGMTTIRVNGYGMPLIGASGLPWIRTVTNWGIVDNFTRTAGSHLIKWGFDLRRQRNDLQQPGDTRGNFVFTEGTTALNGNSSVGFSNAFASFLLDRPNSISAGYAVIFPTRREWIYNLYFQDKWQISPKLTVDLGVRWEYWPGGKPAAPGGYSNYDITNNTLVIAGVGNNPMDMGVDNKLDQFAPRLGVAYRMNEKTVFRGGYGISYLPRVTANWNYPITSAASYNAPNSYSPAGSLAVGLPPPQIVQIPANGILPAPVNEVYRITPKDWFQGFVQSWNIALQRALPGNFALTVAYVANKSIGLPTIRELNYGKVLGGGAASQPLRQSFGRTASTATITDDSPASYNGLQVKFDRKFSGGFMLTTSYTYSRGIDYFTDFNTSVNPGKAGLPYDQWNLANNRGRGDFDVTHVFVQSYIYDLPFGKGKQWMNSGAGKWLLGGWQVNGILTLQTGTPLNITASNAALNTPLINNRPNLVGSGEVAIYRQVGKGIQWFDTTRFANPAPLTFGNVGRNILEGPATINLDFSLSRTFVVTEKVKALLRIDSFNFTNTPHYDAPNTTFGSATFGQVTTAGGNYGTGRGDPRQFQIGLKVFF